MSIRFDNQSKTFKLDTKISSYLIQIHRTGHLVNLYYGSPIPDATVPGRWKRWASASFSPYDPVDGIHGISTDTAPMEYGTNGAGDFRISALSVRNHHGDSTTDIRYVSHRVYVGKQPIPGMPSAYANAHGEAETLEIDCVDPVTGVQVTLIYTVFPDAGIMTRRVRITNPSAHSCRLERALSLCVDLPSMDFDLITLYGRHNNERNYNRRPLARGLQGIESKRGSSSHNHNPFAAIVERGANEEYGRCYGFHLVYSGNFIAMTECDFNATTRFVMGINPTDFSWKLNSGDVFHTPEAVMVYTDRGIGEMSRILHRFYHTNLIRGRWKTEKRPLLINNWEGTYFDFNTEKLVAFAETAKELGIEMLVMDDGWFGRRNDDNCSLGDWFVNEEKLPGGLGVLVDKIHGMGLKFGMWFEPEMVSPDSELHRAHPDWHIHVTNRAPQQGRHQYVLDLTRKEVRENIWQQMDAILSQYPIDYIKWDFNRNISDAASGWLEPDRQGEFFHRYVLGTYELMERLVTTYPHILLENCSGGGGRFDPGMLSYSPQIWTSDNTDPIDRLAIQFGTSLCYPASAMGAHVSACSRTGIATRGDVALWGTFGYELDPRKLTAEERKIVKKQVSDYHKYYDLIHYGDLYRLISPWEDPHHAVWEFVSQDRQEALVTKVTVGNVWDQYQIVKLRGLEPEMVYHCPQLGLTCSGALLMFGGINMTEQASWDYQSVKLYFHSIKKGENEYEAF